MISSIKKKDIRPNKLKIIRYEKLTVIGDHKRLERRKTLLLEMMTETQ